MVRFKVVRASRLLLAVSIAILVAAAGLVAYSFLAGSDGAAVNPSANLVEGAISDGVKTNAVFAPSAASNGIVRDRLPLAPAEGSITIEILREEAPTPPIRVLIYHTHSHEAYEQVSEDPYEALEAWRTADADHSVMRVGEALARELERRGLVVTHDTTDHEGQNLSTAYSRSLRTLQGYATPFDLYIDLHRDAYMEGVDEPFISADGEPMAQLMMLIGNGNGFEEKPYYAQNLAFAQALEQYINTVEPGLCKPTLVKNGRYNQHIGVFSILVEVGHNRNTLREALNAVPPLAEGIASLMIDHPDESLVQMKAEYDASR